VAATHAEAEAERHAGERDARRALHAKQRGSTERRRLEVHALNKLLALSDARQVELAFGPGVNRTGALPGSFDHSECRV
jgi:hypothetical protein